MGVYYTRQSTIQLVYFESRRKICVEAHNALNKLIHVSINTGLMEKNCFFTKAKEFIFLLSINFVENNVGTI